MRWRQVSAEKAFSLCESTPAGASLPRRPCVERSAVKSVPRSPKIPLSWPTQDGRELRRYCRRWKIERLFAWLHNFRRLVIRWEYHEANFLGLLQLGCVLILMRNYL